MASWLQFTIEMIVLYNFYCIYFQIDIKEIDISFGSEETSAG